MTYHSQGDHFTWDNTDVRYANNSRQLTGKPLTYGITFNNSPTVEDLWNSTPAWGYPFISNDLAPAPAAAQLSTGRLAQDVAGYLVGTIYRSEHIDQPQPNQGTNNLFNISGIAPLLASDLADFHDQQQL